MKARTALLLLLSAPAGAAELYWNLGLESTLYTAESYSNGSYTNFSASVEPEFIHQFAASDSEVKATLFARFDEHDADRSRFDIRELHWLKNNDNWDFLAGFSSTFWGVAETYNPVNIINQTDMGEDINDGEKLGQPMLKYTYYTLSGSVELYLLTGFRERTFPDLRTREHVGFYIDTDETEYESGKGKDHVDVALRWSHQLDAAEFALSYFQGTSREPVFGSDLLACPSLFENCEGEINRLTQAAELLQGNTASLYPLALYPIYTQIQQLGWEYQYVAGAALLKGEGFLHKNNSRFRAHNHYYAGVAGAEYTVSGLFDTPYDITFVLEFAYDSRQREAGTIYQNDTTLGLRMVMNNQASTEFRTGVVLDNQSSDHLFYLDASHRINDNLKLELEARVFESQRYDLHSSNITSQFLIGNNSPQLLPFDREDYIRLELLFYY